MKYCRVLSLLSVPFSVAVVACSSSGSPSFTGPGASAGTSGSAGSTASGGAAGAAGSGGAAAGASSASGGVSAGGGATGGGAGGATGAVGGGATGGGAGGATGAVGGGATGGGAGGATGAADPRANFFVSSDTSATANLHGLVGADQRCQGLAAAVGLGSKTWHAYLSAQNPVMNARDRIGEGPYVNVKGVPLAATKAALHARSGDPALFITEKGDAVDGQWNPGPLPWTNQHDILTGTNGDGTLHADFTCGDWTATTGNSWVGHTDGMGPMMSTAEPFLHWNSVHSGQCGNTTPGGGAGRIYCFVAP